jgi:putative addiction module killer protein
MNTIETTEFFDDWMAQLRDLQAVARINARIRRAESGNFGDMKPVGEGVSEMRIHYGPGYRVYFTQKERTIYLLLAAGDKSTQAIDIGTAQNMARKIKEQKENER